jgi:RNA polymerase sigma-70 factor (ECF subfamily)
VISPDSTCWTLIRDAAGGDAAARERFARVYLPAVRAYLVARWGIGGRDVDDAAQDVFVECFKANGLLAKVDADRPGGFRAFMFGAVRNVAAWREAGRRPAGRLPDHLPTDEASQSKAFDRAWARSLLKEAARVLAESATADAARKRIELLRLRFQDGLPIRDIAGRWGADPTWVHHEYATGSPRLRPGIE